MITLPKLDWPREPFRGIEQFRFVDRPIFFERRDEIRRLIRLVSIYRGTLLYGESGVGKSSVINAGLIPAMLDEGFLPERLRVQPVPGAELVVERIALTDEGTAPFLPSRFAADDESRTRLVFSTADMHARLGLEHAGGAPLLILDQFEEFITLFEEAPENREKFAEATQAQNTLLDFFRDLLRDETLPVKLLFVFREDYLAKLSRLFALVPNLRDQHVRLTFPDSSVLKKLIRGPFTCEIPPEHFGHVISEELANKLCAALAERSESGAINLTEVQIACLSLWHDPKMESLFDATPNRAEVVQKLLEGHLTGSLDRLSAGLREPAVAILRHLVTPAGTRNIILEADLLERLQITEKIPQTIGKRALAELTDQSRLVRKQRRNEAYFYDITSEFLVPWIRRQRVLSDARIAMRKFRKRVGVAVAISAVILGAIGYVAFDRQREAEEKLKDEARENEEKKDLLEQNAEDLLEKREWSETAFALPRPVEAPPEKLPEADSSGAAEFKTDKVFSRHKGAVWRVHYGPAIAQLASAGLITAGHDFTARIWDLVGDHDFALMGHRGEVNDALLNPKPGVDPNAWFAATASDDTKAALWKIGHPLEPFFLEGHKRQVTGLAWTADGKWLATTSRDGKVGIWNVEHATHNPVAFLEGHTDSVWTPELVETAGKIWLVTPSADGTARLWILPSGEKAKFSKNKPQDSEVLRHGEAVRRVAMDSQARWIVTAGADGKAILWDRQTGERLATITHSAAVRDVAFRRGGNADDTLFVTASADKTAQVWDAQTRKPVVELKGHEAEVFSARFTPYGPGVVTVSWDNTARLWNYQTKKCVAILRGHRDVLWSVEFSPSGLTFTTTSGDGTARLWDLKKIPGGDAFLPPGQQQQSAK
jgi:WD40 repeat protein